ncbi:MAG: phosphatase PAP2 family protein, partial [Deltaproteobacteria bacterium]|nr:phosphatase PAP2 family protein [Deltaproteobacteria bacterium]
MTAWESVLQFDRDLFLAVNGIDHPVWNAVFGWGTWLGDGLVLTLLLFALTRLFDRRRFPKNFALIGLGMALAGLVNGAIKDAVDRPRPLADAAFAPDSIGVPRSSETFGLPIRDHEFLAQTHDVRRLKVIGPQLRRESFGSGHTTAAFAFAAGMIYAGRRRARRLWLAFGAFVGASRMVCGVHFPLDVLAGAILGCGSSFLFLRTFEMFHGLASVPRPWPRRARPEDLNVMMVVGEASADVYGARILEKLRERVRAVDAWGVGGERLRAAGFRAVADAHDLSIVGFTAVVTSIVTIVRIYTRLMRAMRVRRPDVLVCIDL